MSNIKTFKPNKKAHQSGTFTPDQLVRAVQVTERNLITVKDWAGQYVPVEAVIDVDSKGDSSNHRVRVKTKKGWRVARVGDWLVRTTTETHTDLFTIVVGKDEFLREHTETTYKAEFAKREEYTRKSA